MALELFSIVGRIAVTGMKEVQAGLTVVKQRVNNVKKGFGGLSSAGSKLDAGFGRLNTSMQGFNTKLQKNAAGIQQAGGILTGFGVAITAIGGLALQTGAQFDAGMRKVAAVSGATEAQILSLRNQAKELGATTQFSATQAADAMGFLAQAGFEANEVLGAIPSTLQLAAAAQLDLGSAADITSNILAGFGIKVEELGRANDVLVKTFTSANTDLVQLGQAMKFVGPVAKAAGVSFEETAAAVGLLGNAGIQASMAGTTLRGAIVRVLNPANNAKTAMKNLGLSVKDADGNFVGLTSIVGQLENSVVRLQDPTQFTADLMTIFGQRAGPGLAALVDQGSGALQKLTTELLNSGGTAARIAKAQMEGLKGAFLEFKSALEGVQIAIVESGIGDLFAMLLREGANVLRFFTTLNPTIIKWGALMVAAFGAAATVIGPFLLLLPTLSAGLAVVSGWIAGAGGLTASLALLFNPIGLAIAAVVAVVAALVIWRDEIFEVIVGIGAWISEFETLVMVFGFVGDVIKAVAGFIGNLFVKAFELATTVVKFLFKPLLKLIDLLRTKGKKALKDQAEATKILALKEEALAKVTKRLEGIQGKLTESHKKAKDEIEALSKNIDDLRFLTEQLALAEEDGNRNLRLLIKTKIALLETERRELLSKGQIEEATDKVTDATEGLAAVTGEAKKAVERFTTALNPLKLALANVEQKLKDVKNSDSELIKKINQTSLEIAKLEAGAPPQIETVADAFTSLGMILDEDVLEVLRTKVPEATQEMVDAFESAGIKTIAELEKLAAAAEKNFDIIRESGLASAEGTEEAQRKSLEARKEALRANGQDLSDVEQQTLDDIIARQKDHTKESEGVFERWKNQVSTIITDFGKAVADVVLGLFTRGKFNRELDQQAKALKDSLAERVQAFEEFVTDTASQISDLRLVHGDSVREMAAEFEDSVREQGEAFEDFVVTAEEKFSDFQEELARKEERAIATLVDRLKSAQRDLAEFEEDRIRRIDKILRKERNKAGDASKKRKRDLKERARDLQQFEIDKRQDLAFRRERNERRLNERIGDIRRRGREDAEQEIARLRASFAANNREEENELAASLAVRRREFQDWVDDTAAELERRREIEKRETEERVAEEKRALEERREDFEEFQGKIKAKVDEVKEETARRLKKEEEDFEQSIDKRRMAFEQWKLDAIAKLEERRVAAAEKLESEETALRDSLGRQKDDFEDFKNDTNAKLDEIAGKYRTLFSDLGQAFKDVFIKGMGEVVTRFVSEFLVGMLFKSLGDLVGNILPGVGKALSKVFGGRIASTAGEVVADAAGTATSTAADVIGQVSGTAASVGGDALSGLAALANPINLVSGVVSAVSGVIANFQFRRMNKLLGLIEESTRRATLFLGDRADGGMTMTLFRILETLDFGVATKAQEKIRDVVDGTLFAIKDALKAMETELAFGFNVKANERAKDILQDNLPAIRSSIEQIRPSLTVNVSELVVREEADIDKISKQLFLLLEQSGGVGANI